MKMVNRILLKSEDGKWSGFRQIDSDLTQVFLVSIHIYQKIMNIEHWIIFFWCLITVWCKNCWRNKLISSTYNTTRESTWKISRSDSSYFTWNAYIFCNFYVHGPYEKKSNKILLIHWFLYFNDNEYQSSNDKLHKIKAIITYLRERFREVLVPHQNLWIDESLMLRKGRLSFKQCIPSKRSIFGSKTYVICDVRTEIILDFIINTGATSDIMRFPDVGVSGSIVITLMRPYLDKGHSLFLDTWFTSPTLFEQLHTRSTGACGTAKANRAR